MFQVLPTTTTTTTTINTTITTTTMTRVWSNGTTNHHQHQEENPTSSPRDINETDFNLKSEGKHHCQQNGNGQSSDKVNGNHQREERDTGEDGDNERGKGEGKKSFFGLCFSEDLESELAEQSKLALKMIYFFQVLPFYVLQFTSGMALGNIFCFIFCFIGSQGGRELTNKIFSPSGL